MRQEMRAAERVGGRELAGADSGGHRGQGPHQPALPYPLAGVRTPTSHHHHLSPTPDMGTFPRKIPRDSQGISEQKKT